MFSPVSSLTLAILSHYTVFHSVTTLCCKDPLCCGFLICNWEAICFPELPSIILDKKVIVIPLFSNPGGILYYKPGNDNLF